MDDRALYYAVFDKKDTYECGKIYELEDDIICYKNPIQALENMNWLLYDCREVYVACTDKRANTVWTKNVQMGNKVHIRSIIAQHISNTVLNLKEEFKHYFYGDSINEDVVTETNTDIAVQGSRTIAATCGNEKTCYSKGSNNIAAITGYNGKAISNGIHSISSSSGHCCISAGKDRSTIAASSGIFPKAATLDSKSIAASNGRFATSYSDSDMSVSVAVGDRAKAISTGLRSISATVDSKLYVCDITGNILYSDADSISSDLKSAASIAKAPYSIAASTGKCNARSVADDPRSVAVSFGGITSVAKGVKGSYLLLCTILEDTEKLYCKLIHVDGRYYKENTYYSLDGKKVIEVKEVEE